MQWEEMTGLTVSEASIYCVAEISTETLDCSLLS